MPNKKCITVFAVGDVCVNRDEPDSMFTFVTSIIKSADMAFCQLETNYTERGTQAPHSRIAMRAHPSNASAIRKAGFNIVSFASNHHLDWGADALMDTIDIMTQSGAHVIGVGKNIEAARKPKIMEGEPGGTRIAFLAYSSVPPLGYWAEANKPGCAPLRAFTYYEQIETDQPGTPAKIHTFAHEEDKAAMILDIGNARKIADIVIVSMHWGIHFTEGEIAAYQKELGYAAIDAGADAIFGHHAHILKPIEVYNRKAIFYSLGNFAFDLVLSETTLKSRRWQELMALNSSWVIDPNFRAYPFPKDSRMSLGAKLRICDNKINKVSFIPAIINEDSQPRFLTRKDKEFDQILKYMERITINQGINTKYIVNDEEIEILV
ncbi:MAG: CapA family protein [Thermodesulfobacteriota bacterium]